MRKALWIVAIVLALAASTSIALRLLKRGAASADVTLYGNVDLRQVALAFNGSDRIAAVCVEEGDRVRVGQLLAELDTRRLEAVLAEAQGQLAAQQQVLLRLKNGTRPEEVAKVRAQLASLQQVLLRLKNGARPEELAQARATLDAARVDAANARANSARVKGLQASGASTQQDVDNAQTALDEAEAKVVFTQKALDLVVSGPRKEDVAEAEAKVAAGQATLDLAIAGPQKEDIDEAEGLVKAREGAVALAQQQLKDARLISPTAGVIRSRIMEPGEMASPLKPVFSIAVTEPKWVRAYLSESDLGKAHSGMPASVAVDSFPGRSFEGWVGFISPTAEFTPKAIQTPDLRTSLVYEVRVIVKDPADELRLGQPATVRLQSGEATAQPHPATPAGVTTTAPPGEQR